MFINKIGNSFKNSTFKGYQHEINNVGDSVLRFNFPFDYETQNAHLEFFKVKKNQKAYAGYEVLENNPIAKVELKKEGTIVNLDNITDLGKEEAFAYRIIIDGQDPIADSGIKIYGNKYTLVTRNSTTPRVQGAAYLVYPDSQRVGVKARGFNDPNTGEIYIDKDEQKYMEGVIRTASNKTGGNIAGLEYNLDYLASNGYKIQPANPLFGGDNKFSHHYANKNNFWIAEDLGNLENFTSYARKLFQKGMVFVNDSTYTSEGLEGIHFQYALRWADKSPQTYYWFKMQGLKDQPLGLGVVPKNKENLRHRVINPPVIIDEATGKIKENPNYKANEETYFQIYDNSQVTDEQISKLDKPIDTYKKLKSGNPLAINTHDDTIVNYVFQIKPEEYKDRLEAFSNFNKNNESPLKLNSPDGTILLAQFSNFKLIRKTEGGFVAWDANTDLAKMNYFISGYDEKIDQAISETAEKNIERARRIQGAYEVQDMAIQNGRYIVKLVNDTQTIYTAQALKGAKTTDKIKELITNGLLPKEAYLNEEKLNNVLNGYYNLSPKGILGKDDVTIKALMELPLDSLELANNTTGVLSTSYFSNRATSKETRGLTRFELLKKNNPHLVKEYEKNYIKTNLIFEDDIKNFTDEIIKKVNASSPEKLLDENGNYTTYGEYVIELLGRSIAKYAFLKSILGENLKAKILPNGEITYDYEDIKNRTSLQALGINGNSPQDEASKLLKLIEKGMSKLSDSDVDFISQAISKTIEGTNVNSFKISEAMVKEASLNCGIRVDALKDLADQDAARNRDVAFDDNWQNLIDFWGSFVKVIKKEAPSSYIQAEMTDIADVMRDNFGEQTSCYENMPEGDFKFKTTPDALLKFFNETGITSEAAYDYFFTDMLKTFACDFIDGSTETDSHKRCTKIMDNLHALIDTRGVDYVRNLLTFIGNHDKPRVLHGFALDMKLFHGDLSIYDEHGNITYENNRNNRIESMIQLSNADDFDSLPIEAKLNIDNPEYFNTVSTYAVAMSQLLRNSINEVLPNNATENEIKYLKLALVDMTNGNFKENGKTTQIPSINIPELSSLENALKTMLQMSGISLSEAEISAILKRANDRNLVEQFTVHGDFSGDGAQSKKNQNLIETILRAENEHSPSGEWDYMKYSIYTANLAGLIRQAFIDVKGSDPSLKANFLKGSKLFVQKYNRATIESNRTKLPFYEESQAAFTKNAYGAKDIKTCIEMLVEQAEFRARKDGILGENEHFSNSNKIVLDVWQNATEPAAQKLIMAMTFLSAMVGIPVLFAGDELGMSAYDEKTKNQYLPRNPLPWTELEDGIFKQFREKIQKGINDSMKIRSRDGIDALNNGTAYRMETSDSDIPAFMMQDGFGNMTISVFNSTGINVGPRFDYFNYLKEQGIKDIDKYLEENGIETINNRNRYVPVQMNKELDFITLGEGLSLPIGLQFKNTDARDNAIYVVQKIKDKIGIVKQGGGKITLNGFTAKNGAMILKHVKKVGRNIPFMGSYKATNHQYNIVTNPYSKKETRTCGEKLSLIAR